MNELAGPQVVIVLSINAGRGFQFLQKPMYLEASIGRNKIESDPVQPNPNPLVCTELMWETQKKEVRKLRSAQESLRINCFTLDEVDHKEKIGFIFINLRCAQAVSSKLATNVEYKWYKLSNVSSRYKQFHPEISLTFTIRDKILKEAISILPQINNHAHEGVTESPNEFSILYLEDGWIQIGELSHDFQKFLMKFSIEAVYNLDLLLEKDRSINIQDNNTYYFILSALGVAVTTKPIIGNLSEPIQLNDKIVMKILCNYSILQKFFNKYSTVLLHYQQGDKTLGTANIQVNNLLFNEIQSNIKIFRDDQNSYFHIPNIFKIPTGLNNRKPCVTIGVSLEEYYDPFSSKEPTPRAEENKSNSTVYSKVSRSSKEKITSRKNSPKLRVNNSCMETIQTITENMKNSEHKPCIDVNSKQDILSKFLDWMKIKSNVNPSEYKTMLDIINNQIFSKNNVDPSFCELSENEMANIESNMEEKQKLKYIEDLMLESEKACGDRLSIESIPEGFKSTVKYEDKNIQTTPREVKLAKSSLTLFKNVVRNGRFQSQILSSPNVMFATKYGCYCLKVTFRSISWKKFITFNGFKLKIQHPKANNALVINCEIDPRNQCKENITLNDFEFSMYFISSLENIRYVVAAYPPKISLITSDNLVLAEDFLLYTKLLLNEETNECNYFATPNSLWDKEEVVCDLQIDMKIEEIDSNYDSKFMKKQTDLEPLIVDDWLAFKTLKDVEVWKQKQQALFQENLKRMEHEKLALLEAEWTLKKIENEAKLQSDLERCKILSEELEASACQLRASHRNRKAFLEEFRAEIEVELRKKLQEEMKNYIAIIEKEKESLKSSLAETKLEKKKLEQRIKDINEYLENIRKTTLTKEQTSCVFQELRRLEEKYQESLGEKAFFKDQWHKALNEVHVLKSEDQRKIQLQITKKKEELKQLGIDPYYAFNYNQRNSPIESGRQNKYKSFKIRTPYLH